MNHNVIMMNTEMYMCSMCILSVYPSDVRKLF